MAALPAIVTADGDYDVSITRGAPYILTLTGDVGSAHVDVYSIDDSGAGYQLAYAADAELYTVIQCPEDQIRVTVIGSNSSTAFTLNIIRASLPAPSRIVSSFSDGGTPVYVTSGSIMANITSPVPTRADVTSSSFSITRPADTTSYASGDLVANSTTAGSVLIPNASEAYPIFRRLILRKSGTSTTNAQFRVHIFGSQPTTSGGDNAALSLSSTTGYLGAFDVTIDRAFADGAYGIGLPVTGSEIINPNLGPFWFVIEARAAYTPISAETFTATFSIFNGS